MSESPFARRSPAAAVPAWLERHDEEPQIAVFPQAKSGGGAKGKAPAPAAAPAAANAAAKPKAAKAPAAKAPAAAPAPAAQPLPKGTPATGVNRMAAGLSPSSSPSAFPPPPRRPVLDTPPPGSASILPPAGAAASPEAMRELEARMRAFAEATTELAAARARVLAQIEEDLLELSIAIATAIIEREVERDPMLHKTLAKAALVSLGDPSQASLRASQQAYTAITDVFGEPVIEVDGVRVQVTADLTIEGLGCIAETPEVRVDGRVNERLRAVARAFEDEHHRQRMELAE